MEVTKSVRYRLKLIITPKKNWLQYPYFLVNNNPINSVFTFIHKHLHQQFPILFLTVILKIPCPY